MNNILKLALLALPALSISLGHNNHVARSLKHRELISAVNAGSIPEATLEKRATARSGVPATWYNVETGFAVACGQKRKNSDWLIAMNSADFQGGSRCGQPITITWNGKTQHATIEDECPTCAPGGIDLSEDLFSAFTDRSVGQIYVSWHLGGSDPAPPPPPPPPPKPKPSPKPTHPDPPPPPPSPTPSPTHTHHTTHSTSSSSSSSSSSASSTSSSASVVATPVVPQGANNVAALFQAYVQIGEVAVAGLN